MSWHRLAAVIIECAFWNSLSCDRSKWNRRDKFYLTMNLPNCLRNLKVGFSAVCCCCCCCLSWRAFVAYDFCTEQKYVRQFYCFRSFPACLPLSLPACLLACLCPSLPASLPASLVPSLPACLATSLPASLPACVPPPFPPSCYRLSLISNWLLDERIEHLLAPKTEIKFTWLTLLVCFALSLWQKIFLPPRHDDGAF